MPRAAFVSGILLMARVVVAQGPDAVVSGTVRDELGRPVVEALAVLDAEVGAQRARTDRDGRFRFLRVAIGRHELRVVRLGFAPYQSPIDVDSGGVNLVIELRTVPIPLDTIAVRATRAGLFGLVATRGVALLPHEPRPVRDGIVEVLDTPYRTGIGKDGRFRFPQLGEGSYSVLVRADRYQARMVPVYVPPDGGVDVTIVVDSTYADYQRRDDHLLRDISRRLREATNPSALVNLHELAAPEGTSLADVLRVAPSALRRGLVLRADVTCVWIEARPRPRMTAADILASEVQAVEVYGQFANGRTMAPPAPWPFGSPCGTGPPPLGLQPPYNVARHIVVWLRHGQ